MKRLSLILCLIALSLLVIGCTGTAWEGWSGFTAADDVLYFGTMDGRVLAISPEARSQKLSFPSENEWSFTIPAMSAPGAICGPACVPASPRATIYATPVVVEDLLCVGIYAGENGKLVAVDRLAPGYTEGVPLRSKGEWAYPGVAKSIGAIVGTPVVVEDTLYVGSSDGKLYALDAIYGEKKWEFDTGGKIWTSPAVEDGAVYVSNYERKLFAVSITDHTLLWEIELPASIASSPVISEGSIYFGTFDRNLYAVAINDGSEKWKFEGGNWFWATPIVKDGVVYAGCLDHQIYALDAITGEKLWQFVADAPVVATPVFSDNLLVAASESGEMYILEPDSGVLVRSVSIGYQVMGPLYAEENIVYVHARNRCVYAIDVQSGDTVWEFCYSDIQ